MFHVHPVDCGTSKHTSLQSAFFEICFLLNWVHSFEGGISLPLSTRLKFSTLMSSYVKALKALCPSLTHLAYAAGRVERAVPLPGSGKSPYGGEQHFVAAGNRTKSFVLLVSLIHIATMNAKNPALSRDICLVSPLKQITHAQSSSSMS